MTLHIFNPGHDEALAFGGASYCPGAAARRMAEQLADLPRWWMAEGDEILRLPPDGSLHGVARPDWERITRIMPWGWDAHIVWLLRRLGAPDRLLPSAEALENLRQLSSRHTAVRVLGTLRRRILGDSALQFMLPAESWWCTTAGEVVAAIGAAGGRAFLKAPWSCSGRGVWQAGAATDARALQRAAAVMKRQGAVEVEPAYRRIADMAMEYDCDNEGHIDFHGLSLFGTSPTGGYQGNVVASQQVLAQRIADFGICTAEQLQTAAEVVAEALADILAGGYRGPLGVDMMLTPQGLHPCIEVNLRMTMGHAAICRARFEGLS